MMNTYVIVYVNFICILFLEHVILSTEETRFFMHELFFLKIIALVTESQFMLSLSVIGHFSEKERHLIWGTYLFSLELHTMTKN